MNKKPLVVILKIGIFVILLYLTHHPLNVSHQGKMGSLLAKRQEMMKRGSHIDRKM